MPRYTLKFRADGEWYEMTAYGDKGHKILLICQAALKAAGHECDLYVERQEKVA